MIQGTGSYVGKSVLCAGLCRLLREAGYHVAPFKAQNMALNSYVTLGGGEIGRAQAVQAEAAGLEPTVDMNPVLLKPSTDVDAQVVLRGRVWGRMHAADSSRYVAAAWPAIEEAYARLAAAHDVVVIEGAGSPAEVNLRDRDIVNMRVAHLADAPVLLVGDIDRGGVFAALLGTLELLPPEDRRRVHGLLINKFRGDRALLEPGLRFLEARTGRPVVGVVPYLADLAFPEEDGVPLEESARRRRGSQGDVQVGVVLLPHIANFTDFDALAAEEGVGLRYAAAPEELGGVDAVILPGSKNTLEDLLWLRAGGFGAAMRRHHEAGGLVVGVCGGFQMLGRRIDDPDRMETDLGGVDGLGLLDVTTGLSRSKTTHRVQAEGLAGTPFAGAGMAAGYEIHLGETARGLTASPLFRLRREGDGTGEILDGAITSDGRTWGTYVHGLFDDGAMRRAFANWVRAAKGLPPADGPAGPSAASLRNAAYDRLAATLRQHLDLETIGSLLGLSLANRKEVVPAL
jgi:adenosylcobyric acid synthase